MVKSVVIDAKNLVKKYGNKSVVDGVHFEVFGGECYGILGPNGAGKTSTMRMIYCSTSVSAGQLNVLGLDVKDHQSEIKSKLGIVPQHDGLDPDFSVRENLELYCGYHGILKKDSKEKIDGLLRDLDLTEHQTKKVDELSGGLRRRVVIARSLVNDPEIVILDEPTTGLDPQARLWIWEKLKRYKKSGKTLILTTHYMEEAEKLCDRVVVMDHGKFLAEGTPADLIRKYVGHEVVEISLESDDYSEIEARVKGDFEYQLLGHQIRIFIRDGQDGKVLINLFSGAELSVRKPTLDDVFLQLSGYQLRD